MDGVMATMRGTGLTKAMVEALPNDGGVLVVHTTAMRHYVEQMVRDLRGIEIRKRCKVIVINRHVDLQKIEGLCGYIDIDHAVEDHVRPIVAAELRLLARQVMSMRPLPA